MAVSPDGLLEWAVPLNHDEPKAAAFLAVSDASGQRVFKTLTVRVMRDD